VQIATVQVSAGYNQAISGDIGWIFLFSIDEKGGMQSAARHLVEVATGIDVFKLAFGGKPEGLPLLICTRKKL
jgi:hypothetical protein